MADVRARDWIELQQLLFDESWQPSITRHRSRFLFRGVPRASHRLETSLQTGGFEAQEKHLLASFRKYALRNSVHGDWIWNWLSVAKHHGLPTRLLDWSYSPLVAMHFATHDLQSFDEDAAIWCIDYRKLNELLPRALCRVAEEEGVNIFTTEMINRVATTLDEFDSLSKDEFVLFFEPPSLDERIVNQFALFSLPSSPRLALDSLLEQRPDAWRRVILPAELKWEVRDKLDQANVTERVLFPGLDGLAAWLRRYFTTREHVKE